MFTTRSTLMSLSVFAMKSVKCLKTTDVYIHTSYAGINMTLLTLSFFWGNIFFKRTNRHVRLCFAFQVVSVFFSPEKKSQCDDKMEQHLLYYVRQLCFLLSRVIDLLTYKRLHTNLNSNIVIQEQFKLLKLEINV